MKLTIFLLVIGFVQASATTFAQKITLSDKNVPLEKVFSQIREQAGVDFLFTNEVLTQAKPVTLQVKKTELSEVLEMIFRSQPLQYSINRNTVVVSPYDRSLLDNIKSFVAPPADVRGRVTDSLGKPLAGATIRLITKSISVFSDEQGSFFMPNVEIGSKILVTFTGYRPAEFSITRENAHSLVVILYNQTDQLNEVMVSTGYQTIPKERATGSFDVITSRDIEKRTSTNILERIEGQASGLLVNVGTPDRSLTAGRDNFKIRGTTTINANKAPLIVLNGFPTELDLTSINPADIENITVLKDAAAASIWGVRAANGVLVIQTKSGKYNTPVKVDYSSILTIAGKPRLDYLHELGSADYLKIEKELVDKGVLPLASSPLVLLPQPYSQGTQLALDLKAGRISQAQYNAQVAQLSQNNMLDQYQQYVLRAPFQQQHNISISGGSQMTKNFLSASYSNEYPNAQKTYDQRLTINFNNDTKLGSKLTFSNNLSVTSLQNNNNGLGLTGVRPGPMALVPYAQIAHASGNGINQYFRSSQRALDSLKTKSFQDWSYNYINELNNADNSLKSMYYRFVTGLNYKIVPNLNVDVKYMLEKQFDKTRNYYSADTYTARDLINSYTTTDTHVLGVPKGGVINSQEADQSNYNLRGQVSFAPNFGPKNELNIIAGAEFRQTLATGFANTNYGYDDRLLTSVAPNYTTTYKTFTSSTSRVPYNQTYTYAINKYASIFGNFSYTYLGKYILSGSIRRDNSNLFGSDAAIKNNPLFSIGCLWKLGEEQFLNKAAWISDLNVRATYGFNGNINYNTSPYLVITPSSSTDVINSQTYASISNAANPLLSAERVKTTNIGIDYGLFGQRVGGSVDYYWRRSLDLLGQVPINPTYGFTSIYANQLEMTSHGLDLELHGTAIKSGKFRWMPSLNFSYNTNKVTKAFFQQQNTTYYTNTANPIQGMPLGSVYVYRFAGLNATGNAQMYNGQNQKILIDDRSFNTNDLGALAYKGTLNPPYFGGFSNTFNYGRFDLFIQTTFKAGNVFVRPGPNDYFALPSTKFLYDSWATRWEKAGDELTTNVPAIDPNHTSLANYLRSDLFVENASYIRLREVILSYHIPVERMKFIKSLEASITGRNLALWTKNKYGIDPDYIPNADNVTLPPSKGGALTIRASF